MGHTKGNVIYGTTCQSCGVFTPDSLALNPKEAQMRRAAPDMHEALKAIWAYSAPKCHGKLYKIINDLADKALAKAEGRS